MKLLCFVCLKIIYVGLILSLVGTNVFIPSSTQLAFAAPMQQEEQPTPSVTQSLSTSATDRDMLSAPESDAALSLQEDQPTPVPESALGEATDSATPLDVVIPTETAAPTETPNVTETTSPVPTETATESLPMDVIRPTETLQEQDNPPTSTEAVPGMTLPEPIPVTPIPTDGGQRILPAESFAPSELVIDYNPDTQLASFVRAPAGYAIQRSAGAQSTVQVASQSFLGQYGDLFGLKNPSAELRSMWTRKAEGKRSVMRYQQIYQGIPIFGAELNMNLDAAYNLISLNGKTISNINLSLQPKVDAAAAIKAASGIVAKKYALKTSSLAASLPELWIYNPVLIGNGGDHNFLAWRMDLTSSEKSDLKELVFVDTNKGSVLLSFNKVEPSKFLSTYTMNHSESGLPGTLVCTQADLNCTNGDADAKNAHLYASQTYDFYWYYHGRDSINNAGMTIKSSVHLGSGYQNAYWDGIQMVYGDGFAMDDVVGHELTHGVTEYESNLIYQNQSGAINESFSDVWGEFVDLTNSSGTDTASVRWLMGEDLSIGAIRNMKDPTTFNDPDRMSSPYYYTGSGDNGGVHYNSGVNNKAVYLMTDGDTFNGYTINGMGITKVAKIYYEAQNNILVSSSNYLYLYNALYQGCQNLIGTSSITADDCQNVRNATLAVEMNQSGGPPPPANDDFDASISASLLPYQDQKVTSGATTASDDPSPSNCGPYGDGHNGNSVWYQYTATGNSPVIFYTLNSDYDTVLSVWTGSRGALSQVSCNDDANNGLTSQIILTPSAGTTYYVMVSGYSSGGTLNFSLVNSQICYTLSLTSNPIAGGTPTASPTNSIGCNAGQYVAGESITLNPGTNIGYTFSNWLEATVTNNILTMPASATTVTANFFVNSSRCYLLTKAALPRVGGTVTVSPLYSTGCASGRYKDGQIITFTATPKLYYHFDRWSSTLVNATTKRMTMPAANRTIFGYFGANLRRGSYNDSYIGIDHTRLLTQRGAKYYGRTQQYTQTMGSTITVNFTGTQMGMYYTAGATYGSVSIQIDSLPAVVLNEYALTTAYKNLWWSPVLARANHKVVITYDASNPTNTPVNFDGVVIK